MAGEGSFVAQRRRPRLGTIVLIVLFHIAAIYGLARAFAPDITGQMERSVVSAFTVTVTTPEEEPPPPEPVPETDEGAAGNPGREAVPKPVTAPPPPVPLRPERPAPRASSTGTADTSGARDQGEGTGAAGEGLGTGSGRGGGGQGDGRGNGGAVSQAVKVAGDIANVRDYPVPPGGRDARIGTSVTIALTVGVDGLPKACRIVRPGPFPDTNQRTCELAMQRFRFRPATNADGDAVQSVYGWKQDFFN